MSINGQGHCLTLVKGRSDFKVKCLTFGLHTQVSDSGPLGPLVWLMLRYFATCSIVDKLRVSLICLMPRYFATCSIVNKTQSDAILKEVRKTIKKSPFKFDHQEQQARIISGQEEGTFGWVTANYLSGTYGVVSCFLITETFLVALCKAKWCLHAIIHLCAHVHVRVH